MSSPQPSSDKLAQIAQRLAALGIREEDIEESFVRSGGHGGQNVNKVSSCVMLLHRPTGLRVKCQTSRHQGINRQLARQMLLDKLEEKRAAQVAEQRSEIEKLRRQKRKRSRAQKNVMLAAKSRHSEKKRNRKFVPME